MSEAFGTSREDYSKEISVKSKTKQNFAVNVILAIPLVLPPSVADEALAGVGRILLLEKKRGELQLR